MYPSEHVSNFDHSDKFGSAIPQQRGTVMQLGKSVSARHTSVVKYFLRRTNCFPQLRVTSTKFCANLIFKGQENHDTNKEDDAKNNERIHVVTERFVLTRAGSAALDIKTRYVPGIECSTFDTPI